MDTLPQSNTKRELSRSVRLSADCWEAISHEATRRAARNQGRRRLQEILDDAVRQYLNLPIPADTGADSEVDAA